MPRRSSKIASLRRRGGHYAPRFARPDDGVRVFSGGGDEDDGASNDEDATGTTTPTRGGEGFTGADLSSALDHLALDRLQAIMESFEVSRGVEVMGTMRQVVVVSAGLDTRAFRVPWPRGTAVFELSGADAHAEAHAAMRRVGAKPPRGCSHRRVRCDPTSWRRIPRILPGTPGTGSSSRRR